MTIEVLNLGFPLARLDKKRNRLEILAPANEYGEHGFMPPQFIPISGTDDLRGLADLLAPYSSYANDAARQLDCANEIAEDVLTDLCGRKGFEGWWEGIDAPTQREVMNELAILVRATIERNRHTLS